MAVSLAYYSANSSFWFDRLLSYVTGKNLQRAFGILLSHRLHLLSFGGVFMFCHHSPPTSNKHHLCTHLLFFYIHFFDLFFFNSPLLIKKKITPKMLDWIFQWMTVVSEKCSGSFCFSKAHKLTHELINLKKKNCEKNLDRSIFKCWYSEKLRKKRRQHSFSGCFIFSLSLMDTGYNLC